MANITNPVTICVEAIEKHMEGVTASSEMPQTRDTSMPYVQVSRTGGGDTEFLDTPIMTLFCWSDTDSKAYMLAENVKNVIADEALDHPYLSASSLISLARDEWAGDGRARYMLQLQLTINKL